MEMNDIADRFKIDLMNYPNTMNYIPFLIDCIFSFIDLQREMTV